MTQKYTKVLGLRMTPEEHQTVIKLATLHHETLAAFARKAIARSHDFLSGSGS